MKRTFCDICGKEIKGIKTKPVSIKLDMWHGTVLGAIHEGEKEIDACGDCVAAICKAAIEKNEEA